MADLATALIAGGAAVAGGLVTGCFALAGQVRAQRAEDARWHREAVERGRTRFHDDRLAAYTQFLDDASDAFGALFDSTRHKQEAAGQPPNAEDLERLLESLRTPRPAASLVSLRRIEGDNPAQRMMRSHSVVAMLASSTDVRSEADAVVHSVLAVARLEVDTDVERWNAAALSVTHENAQATQRFIDAANKELTNGGFLWGSEGQSPPVL